MFKLPSYAIFWIYVQYIKTFVGTLLHSPHVKESKKNISCNSFIKKDLKLWVKNKKKCFPPLKQCLSGHLIQFFKFMSNTLKNYVGSLFPSPDVKE